MRFIGNCVNLFDDETGDCLDCIFDDVSDFGHCENLFDEKLSKGEVDFIQFSNFNVIVGPNDIVQPNWQCYFYPRPKGRIYVAYDPINDVHWFWA